MLHIRSTITIQSSQREALFRDLQRASGYIAATQDWEILSDWYCWSSTDGGEGALVYLQPERSDSGSLLSPQVKAQPHRWLEVCKILAPYTPEGSVLEWGDGDTGFFRFVFRRKTVVYQVGEVLYRDQPLPE